MKTIKLLITALLFLASINLLGQDEAVQNKFHKIEFTASSIHVTEWNITDTSGVSFVQERVDNKGRVVELKFYNSIHKLDYTGSGYYGGPIIRYEYGNNKIIETAYFSDNEYANDFNESEVPFRFIYYLNPLFDPEEIKSIETVHFMKFVWEKKSVEKAIKHLEFYLKFAPEQYDYTNLKSVFGYRFSSAKMNGINPIRK